MEFIKRIAQNFRRRDNLREHVALSPLEIIESLNRERYTADEAPRSYIVRGKFNAQHLQHLQAMPFECGIAELDGALMLTTGETERVGFLGTVSRKARVVGHSHPGIRSLQLPSPADLMHSKLRGNPEFLLEGDGIILYNYRGSESALREWNDELGSRPYLDREQLEKHATEQLRQRGVFIHKVRWDDEAGMAAVLRWINLEANWRDTASALNAKT